MIRKLLVRLPFFIALFFITTRTAYAAVETCNGAFSPLCDFSLSSLENIIPNLINILFVIATVAALFFLIFGGIRWITSGGDKQQLENARNMLLAAAIGLAITFASYFILNIVMELFGLPTATEWQIPALTEEPTGGGYYGDTCTTHADCVSPCSCLSNPSGPGKICRACSYP